jgi:hypothetical protein
MRENFKAKVPVAVVCFVLLTSLILINGSLTVNAASSSFGYLDVGDSNSYTFGGVYVTNFTSPSNLGNITQIRAYLATGGASAKAVIYSDNHGKPENLLTESSEVSQSGTSGTWVTFDVSFVGSPDTVYWLGVVFLNAGTYYYGSGASEKTIYSAPVSNTLNPFPAGQSAQANELSIYAVYTPTTTPDQNTPGLQTILLWTVIAGIIIAAVAVAIVAKSKKTNKT